MNNPSNVQRLLVVCPVCRAAVEVLIPRPESIATGTKAALDRESPRHHAVELSCQLTEVGFVCPECQFSCTFTKCAS